MPKVPRLLRSCTFCATSVVGDERACVSDWPHFQGLQGLAADIFEDPHDAMKALM